MSARYYSQVVRIYNCSLILEFRHPFLLYTELWNDPKTTDQSTAITDQARTVTDNEYSAT
jgi:hypothetical protein